MSLPRLFIRDAALRYGALGLWRRNAAAGGRYVGAEAGAGGQTQQGVSAGAAALFARLEPGLPPMQAYDAMCEDGKVHADENQRLALKPLTRLHNELLAYEVPKEDAQARSGGLFGALFGNNAAEPTTKDVPQGVYLQGGVGTGKSFCMDLFYHCQTTRIPKARVHFHDFMAEVHRELHKRKHLPDPLPEVAKALKSKAALLCFDEFQVTDVADAMILRRLLEALRACGCVLVFTSNRMPQELYKNGLNRAQFLPAIALLEEVCEVHSFDASARDYRLTGTLAEGAFPWFVGTHESDAGRTFERVWSDTLCKGKGETNDALVAMGRRLELPRVSKDGGSVRLTFDELFGQPLGASDYGRIVAQYHTVVIDGVPLLSAENLDKMRRFITGIDVMYERKAKLVFLAAAPVLELFDATGLENRDESFAWDRTVSRLTEMSSEEYRMAPWQPYNDGVVR